jgi:hypothetical protein
VALKLYSRVRWISPQFGDVEAMVVGFAPTGNPDLLAIIDEQAGCTIMDVPHGSPGGVHGYWLQPPKRTNDELPMQLGLDGQHDNSDDEHDDAGGEPASSARRGHGCNMHRRLATAGI